MGKKKRGRSGATFNRKRKSSGAMTVPMDMGSLLQQAVGLHQAGDLDSAEARYHQILNSDPKHPDALHLLGMVASQRGDFQAAVDLIRKAIESFPQSDIFYNNLGNALARMGRRQEAVDAYRQALAIKPDSVEAINNLATNLNEQGFCQEALDWFEQAIQINPQAVEVLNNMGNALTRLGDLPAAIQRFQQALALKPDYVAAHNNLATAFKLAGHYKEAVERYSRAIACDPTYAEGINNLGETLAEMGQSEEAIVFFERAIQIKPEFALATGNLMYACMQICAWDQMEDLSWRLEQFTRQAIEQGQRPAEDPFMNLARVDDPKANLAVARAWSEDVQRRVRGLETTFSHTGSADPGQQITLGYLSDNFRDHALGQLIGGLFKQHDRKAFAVHVYSTGVNDHSRYRKEIEQACDRFVDIREFSHIEAARRIHEDQVDILIDLMGHTKGARLEIAALRPAPVQVRYMGMAGTTGADFFDGLIADSIVVPEAHARHYSEKLVYLPHCYQVNDYRQFESQRVYTRSEMGLPDDAFVFCSFNASKKLDEEMYAGWMRILRQVPGSVLWLQAVSQPCEANLRGQAEREGIDPARIVFGQKMDKPDHLARLQLADLALDTRLVNGAATTSDALWAGVPVIALTGRHFASRMSTSLLTAMDLPHLAVATLADYVALATHYGMDPVAYHALRQKLQQRQKKTPLFDTDQLRIELEAAYKEIWRLHKEKIP